MNLNELTIKEASEGLKNKDFSAVELTKACLDRIKDTDEKVNSFITVTDELALEKAKEVDKVGDFSKPLAGIPVAVKDLFCTAGVRSTAASNILKDYIPPHSATAVLRLEEQGAIVVGKTNLDEFAMGASNENSSFGPTKNPWDLDRVPGGSSGGSAASVSANQSIFALGTDTGGSIRQPSSFCGTTGLKVTYGRVPRYGVMSYASSFDTIGPITKTVEDAALVLNSIAGADPKDSTTPKVEVDDYTKNLTTSIKGLKIGIPKEYFIKGIDPEVEKTVRTAISKLEELGAEVHEVSLPLTQYAIAAYYILVKSEASSNLARYDGIRYGSPADAKDLLNHYLETRSKGFGPEVKRSIMMGTYALSSGYYDAYYQKAAKVRTLMRQEFDKVFDQVDCLVSPTSPTTAFKIGDKVNDPLQMYLSDIFTVAINLVGVPAISVPCGFVKPGDGDKELPVGLQVIGKQFDEATILQVANQYQVNTNWHTRKAVID